MGKAFSKCLEKKPSNENENDQGHRKITYVTPSQLLGNIKSTSVEQLDRFYCIPNEERIDKTIAYLDEIPVPLEKDILLLNNTLLEVCELRRKYKLNSTSRHTMSPVGKQASHQEPNSNHSNQSFVLTQENEMDSVTKRSQTLAIPLKSSYGEIEKEKEKENKKSYLIVRIQSAIFLHEEMLQKHNMQKPYVVARIYCKPGQLKADLSSPSPKAELKCFTTNKCDEIVKPSWGDFFEYQLDVEDEEKETKFPLYSVGISMYYTRGPGNEVWQVGEEHHFSLSSLMDQKMQAKVIDFKDLQLKGILARLNVKLQLVHNAEELRERVGQDIELRIEKLLRIKQRFVVSTGNKGNMMSFKNSIGEGFSNQSPVSVYSFTGLKENPYYLS